MQFCPIQRGKKPTLIGLIALICIIVLSLGARYSYSFFIWKIDGKFKRCVAELEGCVVVTAFYLGILCDDSNSKYARVAGGRLDGIIAVLYMCNSSPCVKQWRPQNVVPYGRDDFPVKIPAQTGLLELSEPETGAVLQTIQVLCQRVVRVGSIFDGGKELCIDEPYKPRRPCLVYSFGINWKWDFDEDMVTLFGCEVFAFDPSMANETDFFKKGPNITFHKIGLWDRHTVDDKGWHLMTLKQIRKKLGHESRVIDVMKIDIDWSEWTALPAVITSGELVTVKQMLIEFHSNDNKETLNVFRMLYDAGFRIFMKERNILGCLYKVPWSIRERPHCIEISFIHI